ncbi:hypothetical protein CTI32_00765 (plasmid) [Enterococcus faecium]|nr:hypothetical protein CTI32_00765 [Enterococcus faecium]NDK22792.1 hypothetical protein [Enterococcus faecium]
MEIKTAKIRTFSPLSLYNFYKIVLLIKSALVKENKRKIKKKQKFLLHLFLYSLQWLWEVFKKVKKSLRGFLKAKSSRGR